MTLPPRYAFESHDHDWAQIIYAARGVMQVEARSQVWTIPPLRALWMPAGVVHSCVASAEGDVLFFVAKDTRHGLAGPPIDGIEDGPRYLPGFGPKK